MKTTDDFENPADVVEFLGAHEMAAELGVSATRVYEVRRYNQIPAGWYLVVERMLAERERSCPKNLFTFRVPRRPAARQIRTG